LSSAILYGAIVVIWAAVLIPRWLRRESSAEMDVPEAPPSPAVTPEPSSESERAAPVASAAPVPAVPAGPATPTGSRDGERTSVLRARRRLLGMLLALATTAGVLAEMRLAAWWVVLPPMIMLLGYLALLREASRADAERRSANPVRATRATRVATAATASVADPAPAHVVPIAPEPDAQVIDITGRVNEEFYDQYTDAKLRAVGD
jgi:hypothetical protein